MTTTPITDRLARKTPEGVIDWHFRQALKSVCRSPKEN